MEYKLQIPSNCSLLFWSLIFWGLLSCSNVQFCEDNSSMTSLLHSCLSIYYHNCYQYTWLIIIAFGILWLYTITLIDRQIRYCYLPFTKATSKFNPRISVVRVDVVKIKLYTHFSFDSIQFHTIWTYFLQTQFPFFITSIAAIFFFCYY